MNKQSTRWYEKSQFKTMLKDDKSVASSWIRIWYWHFGTLQKPIRCSESANCSKTWRVEKKFASRVRKEFLLNFSKKEGKGSKLTHAVENFEFSSFSLQRTFKTGPFTQFFPADWSVYSLQNSRSIAMKIFESRSLKTATSTAEGGGEVKYHSNINWAATT